MRTKQRNNLAETARHERVAQNTDVYAVKARNYKGLRRGSPVFDNEQDFIDSTLLSYKMDDHYWAVPIDSICYSLLYRPSALEAAGYTEPPKTWSELKEYAEKMTVDTDGDGNIDQYGIGITCSRDALATDTFGAFMASANTDIFDEDGKIVFDNDNTVKALDFYNELYQYAPQAASGWSWGEIESNWAAGTFAMMPYHSPNLAAFFENGDFVVLKCSTIFSL